MILSCRLRCCAGELQVVALAEEEAEADAINAAAEVEATTLMLLVLLHLKLSDSSCESYSVSVLESSEEFAQFSRSARSFSNVSISLAGPAAGRT